MATTTGGEALEAILDEFRLDDAYYELHQAALLRRLALAEAERHGVHPDSDQAVAELRTALGLTDDDALSTWLSANDLDMTGLRRLAVDQARLAWVHRRYGDDVTTAITDQLRIRGWYPPAAPPGDVTVDENEAWDWYATTRDLANRGWPDPREGEAQTQALATHLGFATADDLRHAVRRAFAARS